MFRCTQIWTSVWDGVPQGQPWHPQCICVGPSIPHDTNRSGNRTERKCHEVSSLSETHAGPLLWIPACASTGVLKSYIIWLFQARLLPMSMSCAFSSSKICYYNFCQSSEKSYMVLIIVSAAGQTPSCGMVLLRYSKSFRVGPLSRTFSLKIAPEKKQFFHKKNRPGTNFCLIKSLVRTNFSNQNSIIEKYYVAYACPRHSSK